MPARPAAPAITADLVTSRRARPGARRRARPRRRFAADLVAAAELELDQEHAGELGRAGDRRRPGDQPPSSSSTTMSQGG